MAKADIQTGRLSPEEISSNFSDMHPPLSRPEALIEADRCYFCYDAPCTTACPTGIDIPEFIQKIRSDNVKGSARTILRDNIMGGMCARVCPTEVLCEEACVRNVHEDKPVNIGLLQRYATDPVFEQNLNGPAQASTLLCSSPTDIATTYHANRRDKCSRCPGSTAIHIA